MTSTIPTNPSQGNRFWVLDLIRGLAVLIVVCFHVFADARNPEPDPSTIWISWLRYGGGLGISIFFVVSGFCIHLSHAQKLVTKEDYQPAWSQFFRRRFWRLYPAYLGVIGLFIVLNSAWALIHKQGPLVRLPDIWNVLSHLLLLHTLTPETFFGIFPALWFIGVQAHLYLLYPVFWMLVQRWNIHRALLSMLLLTLAFRLLSQSVILASTAHPHTKLVLWNNAPQRWFEWCFGAWIAQQVVRGVRFRLNYAWGLLMLLALWVFNKDTLLKDSFSSLFQVIFDLVLGYLIGLILWSLVVNEDRLRLNRVCLPIIYLGQISYSVYLVHQIFVPYVNLSLKSILLNDVSHFILVLLGVLIVTLPVSVLFHKLLEIPFAQRGTKLQS
jgi:peptidoglycan/LPS O-acetylase OafA/YrhL